MSKKLQQHLREIQKRGPVHRAVTFGAINAEARTVDLAFSSETETVERWYGIEVLGHDAGEIDLSRMNNGAPLCWMHDLRDQRGVVVEGTARVDADRVARCTVRFSKSDEGEEIFQDVIDGIKRKVSVGYNVTGMKLVEERDGIDVYRITAWQPYEVSMVSAAADDDMGVGRSLENPPEEPQQEEVENSTINTDLTKPKEIRTMKIATVRAPNGDLVRAEVGDDGAILKVLETIEAAGAESTAGAQRGAQNELARSSAILALGDKYASSVPNARELASQMVRDNKTEKDMQDALLVEFNKRAAAPLSDQGRATELGMTEKDVKRYSMMKVIRALANPNSAAAQKEAAYEIEMSVEAQRALGKEAKGILIPPDVLSRAFNTGSNPAGGSGANLVDHSIMRGSFIDLLRNKTTMMRLATVLGGLVGTVDIPKQTGAGQAYWLGEGQDAQETGLTLGQITLTPKTLGAYTDITRRLSMQSTPDAEGLVRNDLLTAMSQAIDYACWYGLGTDYQPRGLKNYSGINGVDFATTQAPTFAELVKMETEIAADNADIGSMGYVGNTRFRGYAKTALKFASAGSATIWEPGNTVNGYRTEITNQISADDVFFGNFADFIIAMWGGLDMTVDPFSLSKSGGLRIVVFQDIDTALRRPESICWGSANVA